MGAILHGDKTAFFTAKAWREDGVWNAEIVDLPVVVFGDSFEEAARSLAEALCSHLKVAAEIGALKGMLESLPQLETARQNAEIDEPNDGSDCRR